MQRPPELGQRRYLTDEEFAQRKQRDDETRGDTRAGAGTFVGEVGTRTLRQSSLVIDPPDGRTPALTPQAQQRAAALSKSRNPLLPLTWEDRSLFERCITRGVTGVFPTIYGNGLRIVQAPGFVIFAITSATRCSTAASMRIVRPHSRCVSPGHLFVASSPILPPRPLTGEAKSR